MGILNDWYNRLWHEPRKLNDEMLAAAKKGNARLVRGLILVGAEMESKNKHCNGNVSLEECNGLHIAARLGHDEVVKTFLSLSPGMLKSEGYNGMTSLATAVSSRRCSTVKLLLEHGAEVDETIVQEANREFKESGEILNLLRLQPLTRTATTTPS